MNVFEFMSDSPWLSFLIVYLLTYLIFQIINRALRTINIHKHGYPPEHCDADGDFKSEEW